MLCLPSAVKAQQKAVFRHYPLYEREVFTALRRTGAITSFNTVRNLQKQGTTVKENTPIGIKLLEKNTKRLTGPEIASASSKSTLMLCLYSFNNESRQNNMLIGATAVVLSADGVCMTNYHILQPFIDKTIEFAPGDSVFFAATQDMKLYSIERVLSYNKAADMAFFKIDTKGDKLQAVTIGDDLPEGSEVHTMSHPNNHYYSYSLGVVARNVGVDPGDPFTNRVEITAPYAKGSSGGGIFDACGNLIGMVSDTESIYFNDDPQQNLQMVVKKIIPISSIKKLFH